MRRGLLMLVLLAAPGCVLDGFGNNGDDTADSDDQNGGGGGNQDQWRARGQGKVYLLDGTADHSLVSIEITNTLEPADGEAYYGWLRGGSAGDLFLGEIPVDNDVVLHEVDVGLNAFREGYTQFEAYASASEPSAPGEGTALWSGQLPEDAVVKLESLLVNGGAGGEGSLRDVETTVEVILAYGQSKIDAYPGDLEMRESCEAVANAIMGYDRDLSQNGTVTEIPDRGPSLLGETDGQLTAIEADVLVAFDAFGGSAADDDIRVAFVDASTCIGNIEQHADEAVSWAGTGTVCGAESACTSYMLSAITNLGYGLDGVDENEDGSIDQDEGTVECAIEALSRLMAFDVAIR